VHPRQNKSQFLGHFCLAREIWNVRVVNLVVLACVLRATTIKRSSTFSRIKFTPRENPGYAYNTDKKYSLLLLCVIRGYTRMLPVHTANIKTYLFITVVDVYSH